MSPIVIHGKRNHDNPLFRKVYFLWYNMRARCESPSHPYYKWYGGCGCRIDERWSIFEQFLQDIDKVDGFNLQDFLSGSLTLDKDKKCPGNKLYSLDTCVFISKSENNKYKPNQQKKIIGTSPEGQIYTFYNQSVFAKEHGLSQNKISACVHQQIHSTKGWKFELSQ